MSNHPNQKLVVNFNKPLKMENPKQPKGAINIFDFTAWHHKCSKDELIEKLRTIAKKWCFQLEECPETKSKHWQGRLSLIKRSTVGAFKKWCMFDSIFKDIDVRPTSNNTCLRNNPIEFYTTKEQTRLDGPWKDTDQEEEYIPRQYRDKMSILYPFQVKIKQSINIFEDRTINMIVSPTGCEGKSTIAALMELVEGCVDLPPENDSKLLVATMCNICYKRTRNPKAVFIDLPRSSNQDKIYGIYTAIEQIKKGKLYDLRHHYKKWWIDSPQVWVFSNNPPDTTYLSNDRWKIWTINENKDLQPYVEPIQDPNPSQEPYNQAIAFLDED